MIRAASEAAVLLIAEAERHERCLLELDGEFLLRSIVEGRQCFGQTHDLERALAEVVCLLGVQEENTVRDFGLGYDERDDRLRTQLTEGTEAVVTVRRPVLSVASGDGDDWIQKSIESVDRLREATDVGLGEIALERGRLDPVERECGEELPVTAERVAIGGEDGAFVVGDRARERRDGDGGRLAR